MDYIELQILMWEMYLLMYVLNYIGKHIEKRNNALKYIIKSTSKST